MPGHTESDFEAAIEAHLLANGWRHGSPTDYDLPLGLDPVQLVEFIQETQPKTWAKLTERHGSAVVQRVTKHIAEEIETHGVVQVLRRGVKDSGQRIQLASSAPPPDSHPSWSSSTRETGCWSTGSCTTARARRTSRWT